MTPGSSLRSVCAPTKLWRGSKRRSSRTASRRRRGRRSPHCCAAVRPTTASSPIRLNAPSRLRHTRIVSTPISQPFSPRKANRAASEKPRSLQARSPSANRSFSTRMEAERDRLSPLVEKRKAAAVAERSLALHALGDAILGEYEHAKRRRGLLDYDDLIEGARRLLHRSSPSWVLYKLDAQIEHILLDEAQDTSSDTMGHSGRDRRRILRRRRRSRWKARSAAQLLCGRRRETVDLFVPRRRA